MFVSLIGTWVQTIAQSWLVYSLTDSPFLLGLVGFLGSLPAAFFSLAAGVLIDRAIKRNVLIITQFALMVLALALAVLVHVGTVKVWHIMLIALISGLVFSVDAPVRQAMVVELAGKQHLFNAITLNSAAFNSARLIGPAIAGVLIAAIGMAGCFYVNAASFIPLLIALFFIQPLPAVVNGNAGSFWLEMKQATEFLKKSKALLALLCVVAMFSIFGVAYIVLMPVFTKQILGVGVNGFAVLMSSNGAGALIGVLNLARLKTTVSKEKILNICVVVFCVSIMCFSVSSSLLLSAAMIFLAGFGGASSLSLINTLFQMNIPDDCRGKLMGIYCMMFLGLLPFGNILAGVLAHFFSVQIIVFSGAILSLLFYYVVHEKFANS